jgi:hypothetical protein
VEVPGTSKHVADAFRFVPEPSPPAPVTVVNDTEPPGITDFVCGVAEGGLLTGGCTVGVIVAEAVLSAESFTMYLIGVAVPENVGSGLNVTTPVAGSTVYTPSPITVSDVSVQLASAVPVTHSRTEVGVNVSPALAVSPTNTSIT